MEMLIILVFIIAIVWFLKTKRIPFEINSASNKVYPYERLEALFTAAERSFYGVLCSALRDDGVVFGKVRVADILKTRKGLSASLRQQAFNRISAKHFDFVICQPDSLSVLAVVELDDASHNSKKRMARDKFLEASCSAAGLQLLRFRAQGAYSVIELREIIRPLIVTESQGEAREIKPQSRPELVAGLINSVCPKCNSELVQKKVSKGRHKGESFLVCSGFPTCRYVKKLTV